MSDTTKAMDGLADALIERLRPLLPVGFGLEHPASSPTIIMTGPSRVDGAAVLWMLRLPLPRRIKIKQAADAVLGAVQHFVDEETKAAWPPGATERAGGPGNRTLVAIRDGRLELGFGSAEVCVLQLAPIALNALGGA